MFVCFFLGGGGHQVVLVKGLTGNGLWTLISLTKTLFVVVLWDRKGAGN